ncbi:4-hydroxy-tetrahydrodipicolinate synthase [Desulfitispora alkaliphila]|uniref:4-hydroxy-tetrahydrodipicolinate synthase n=1 Tax=Desulfitispora alkaliphila TaxID=622674 RepID=UPI003D1A45D6
MNFGKVLTAMVTPFDENLNVDYHQVKVLARHLADNGSEGIVIAGTTGEAPTLTNEEKLELFKTVKSEVGDRVKVLAGTGSNNTAASIELTQEAAKVGVDAIMLVAPYYNKPSQRGLYHHFSTLAKSVKETPVMLYNVPGRTSCNMLPETVSDLAKIDNIVSVKESSGDMDQATAIRKLVGSDFTIYSGDDSLTLPLMSLGACGVVSVAAHIAGNEIQKMVSAFQAGNVAEALEWQLKLFDVFKGMFITSSPVPVKTALNLQGIEVGGTRAPLVPPTADEVSQIQRIVATLKQ